MLSAKTLGAVLLTMDVFVGLGSDGGVSFFLGEATSMEKVLPLGAEQVRPLGKEGLSMRLAQNEREAVQLVVIPQAADADDVRVSVSNLYRDRESIGDWFRFADRFPASDIACRVMGYVLTTNPPPYKVGPGRCRPEVGWWPDPILEYLDHTGVSRGVRQSFWIRVSCPEGRRPGRYRGTVTVTVRAGGTTEEFAVPLTVRVNGFVLAKENPLPLAITFAPSPNTQYESASALEVAREIAMDPESPVNAWRRHREEWADFLMDYGIGLDDLYHRGENSPCPYLDLHRHLKEQGRPGWFNLGYWNYPRSLDDAGKTIWRKETLGRLRTRYERAKKAGLLDRAYIYGCDEVETNHFEHVKWAVDELKAAFPEVPVATTAYDHEFGVGTALSAIDCFTPLTPAYNPKKAAASRAAGHKVWWYICCIPHAPYANMFVESPAIEGRLLMGAQTVRMRPDGFLYYQISLWNARRPISGRNAFTDWTARSWTTYHGDGSWCCCGPDGIPLATIRLENFRDGLEDYQYALALERGLKAHPDAPWAAKARELLAVPATVMRSMTDYTYDPFVLLAWRNAMADLLEECARQPSLAR